MYAGTEVVINLNGVDHAVLPWGLQGQENVLPDE